MKDARKQPPCYSVGGVQNKSMSRYTALRTDFVYENSSKKKKKKEKEREREIRTATK